MYHMTKIRLILISIVFALANIQCVTNKVTIIDNGAVVKVQDLNVKVVFYSPGTVRVVKWLSEAKPDTASLVVIQKTLPALKIDVKEDNISVTLSSENLNVIISKTDGQIAYVNKDSSSILKETGKAIILPVTLKNEKAYSIQQHFELTPDEGIYGLGQHQDGYMNYRGRTVKLVQANTQSAVPLLVSTKGYGILWDNYSKT